VHSLSARAFLALAALALLSGLVVLAGFLWRRLRARRVLPRRIPRLRHPLVLAHGFLGFDEVAVAGVRREYFQGLEARLARHASAVHRPRLPAAGAVITRATELAACIRSLPDRRVNVIAHSMGGLDARYALTHLGLGSRVASLTTIGTPHFGTPLADLGRETLKRLGLARALRWLGIGFDALFDLSSEGMADFNRKTPDASGVAYASVVGVAHVKRHTHPLLIPGLLYLRRKSGENDGLVPTSSQRWGEVLWEIEADHWAQIGWSKHFDAPAFYEKLVEELRGRGF